MAQPPKRFPRNDIMSLTAGTPRYDLAESIGPDLLLRELLNPAEDGDTESGGMADLALSYGTTAGDPALRQALAESHGVDADDVVITVGGMQALFLIAFILCRPGDKVVTTAPLFPNARNTLVSVGAEITDLPLSFDNGYRLDLEALRRSLSAETKLVALATPQNPSGVAVPQKTIREILALMAVAAPDAYLLVDETYREAAYGDAPVTPSMAPLDPRIVSCASLSKCHGAPGLRLGWAITRDAVLREQLLLGKFTTVIACSRADEALALRVLQRGETIIGARRKQLHNGLAKTVAWVAEHGDFVDWVRPDAGALCCIRLKPEVFDDAAVARFYDGLAGQDVRVADGRWFGDEARVFRLGFGLLSMAELDAGLAAVATALRLAVRDAA